MAEIISTTEAKAWMRVDISDDDTLVDELIRSARQYCENITRRQFQTAVQVAYADNFVDGFLLETGPAQSIDSITYLDISNATQTLSTSIYELDIKEDPALVRLSYNQVFPTTLGTANNVQYNYLAGYASLVTFANGANLLTVSQRTFTAGDRVRLWNTGGGLPGDLSTSTPYFVINVATNDFQVALTAGGSAVTFTDDGSGASFIEDDAKPLASELKTAILMLAAEWYENREVSIVGTIVSKVSISVERILTQYSMPRIA